MLIEDTLVTEVASSGGEMLDQEDPCYPVYGKESHLRPGKTERRVETAPRSDRSLTLAAAAREYVWLYDRRHGVGINEIAAREGLSVDRVKYGLKRARALDKKPSRESQTGPLSLDVEIAHIPRLIPLFPIGSYTPESVCPHMEPIGQGSALCCMVCHCSGMDAHPSLLRDPQTDPAPEPTSAPAPDLTAHPKADESHETRRRRRRRMFARQAAPAPGSSE